MHLILTGATGLVGSATLNVMLRNPTITRVSIFSRSAVPQATDSEDSKRKCTVIEHKDFNVAPSAEVLSQVRDAQGCVWALGISAADVTPEQYEDITFKYPMTFARAFADAGVGQNGRFNFVYVSGEGASTTPGFTTMRFGKVKGRAEAALLELAKEKQFKSLKVFSARPAGVDRRDHPEIAQYLADRPVTLIKSFEKPLMTVLRSISKSMISPTRELGDALVQLAAGDGEKMPDGPGISGEGRTLSNVALRRMVGI